MFRAYSAGPVIRRKGRKLVIQTNPAVRRWSLGLVNRTVVVDPDRKHVRVRDHGCWFRDRVEVYPFDLITGVTFDLSEYGGRTDTVFGRDPVESYSIGLRLYGSTAPDVHLFRFVGEGRFRNEGPLPDWVYWFEALTDRSGTQEEDARSFVTVLGRVLNKPVVRL